VQRLQDVVPAVSHETIVIMNGAPEADAARLRVEAPHAQVHASPVNLGFAGALNAGRALADGEFIVSLHDDAEVRPGWLEALVAAADRDADAGAVGSLVLGSDGRVQAAGWRLLPDGSARPPWDREPPPPVTFNGPRPVDYSPSCSLLVRAASWDDVGGVDERFFPLYYVDVDMCLAIRARGQRVVCEPASVIVPRRGASTDRDFAVFLSDRNRELLLEKWGQAIVDQQPGFGAPLSRAAGPVPSQQRAGSEADRKRLATVREAATRRAYAAALGARLATSADELESTRNELEWTRSELDVTGAAIEVARAEVETARDELHRAVGDREAAESQLADLATRAAELQRRSDALARVEAGGWWRMRRRLLPLIRLVSGVRSAIRR
jgi:hypothetical protein